jgi:putative endonuclease
LKREYHFFVYILASKGRRLYTGVTNSLRVRTAQHKSGEYEGFTHKYRITRLVYFEQFQYVNNAIAREKEIKSWSRAKKIALIESFNPSWADLAEDDNLNFVREEQIPRRSAPRNDNSASSGRAAQRAVAGGSR